MKIIKSGLIVVFAIMAVAAMVSGVDAKEWKKVRIGTEGAYPPFNYYDSDSNLIGFEVDLAKALCEKMQVECVLVAQDWDGIIPALVAGKYDGIMASMSATPERRKVIDFSDKYYDTPSSFIANKKNANMDASPKGMAGKRIGAQSSTIQANYLQENYPDSKIKLYASQDNVYLDLTFGRLDALLVDKIVGLGWLEKNEDGKCCQFIGKDIPIGEGISVGLRKGDDELKMLFNKAIKQVLEDGTYKKINDKYFPFSVY